MFEMDAMQKRIAEPPLIAEKDQYLIKFAVTEGEIEEAFRLRYAVFNVEQGKGLSSSTNGIDKDPFDAVCLHLIVVRKNDNRVTGTYRIHFGETAIHSKLGFYSEQEFAINGLDRIASESIEVGRSCVAPDSRNGTVMALLWSGISGLICRSKQRYLLGCVSLETTDPSAGWTLYEFFKENGYLHPDITAAPRKGYELAPGDPEKIRQTLNDRRTLIRLIPPLFKGYLRLGAKICGEPAYDFEFGSIDFFIILDVHKVPERYMKHFNVET